MKAKISSAVERNERSCWIVWSSSLATVWPLTTSTSGGRTRSISRWTVDLVGAGFDEHVDRVVVADGVEQPLRRRQVEGRQRRPGEAVGAAEGDDAGDREGRGGRSGAGSERGRRWRSGASSRCSRRSAPRRRVGRRPALHEPQRRQLRVGIEREAARRSRRCRSRCRMADQLRIAADRAVRELHARAADHGRGNRLRDVLASSRSSRPRLLTPLSAACRGSRSRHAGRRCRRGCRRCG